MAKYILLAAQILPAQQVYFVQENGNLGCGDDPSTTFYLQTHGSTGHPKLQLSGTFNSLMNGTQFRIHSNHGDVGPYLCRDQNGCDIFVEIDLAEKTHRWLLNDLVVGRATAEVLRNGHPPCLFKARTIDSIAPTEVSPFVSDNSEKGLLTYSYAHTGCAKEILAEWRGATMATPDSFHFQLNGVECSYQKHAKLAGRMVLIKSTSNWSAMKHDSRPANQTFTLKGRSYKVWAPQ